MLIKLSEHMKPVKALDTQHLGEVVDNLDPLKLGRVKCTIAGLIEGETDSLPWINSNIDPSSLNVPEIGAQLRIEFPFNDIYSPVFTGYFHSEKNLVADFDTDYPNTIGFSKQGFSWLYNLTKQVFSMVHPSGAAFELNDSGNLNFSTSGEVSLTSDATMVLSGSGGTDVGDSGSQTNVNGSLIMLAGGGPGIALIGSQCMGTGNLGSPVISLVLDGSTKVLAAK